MNVYDTVLASTLPDVDEPQHIIVLRHDKKSTLRDPLENIVVKDLGAVISVKGWSHNSGDNKTYFLDPFEEVELWEA